MIVAVAGRRVDAPGATPAFPLERAGEVREAIAARLRALRATAVVASAACGADLVALDAARRLGLRRRVVLPFDRATFRTTSVADRPGDWGALYDLLCDEADASGDLVVLGAGGPDAGDAAYLAANEAILDEAVRLAAGRGNAGVRALVVWNGPRARGRPDATAAFATSARRRGVRVEELPTLPGP